MDHLSRQAYVLPFLPWPIFISLYLIQKVFWRLTLATPYGVMKLANLNPHQQELKDEFIKNRGYWSDFWEDVLKLDSNFFSAYSKFSSVPSKNGHFLTARRRTLNMLKRNSNQA